MTSFEEMTELVLAVADRRGIPAATLAAELRVLAEVAMYSAGFDATAVRRMDAVIAEKDQELAKLARRAFRRRGRSIPPEDVS